MYIREMEARGIIISVEMNLSLCTRSINEAELRVKLEEVQHKSSETNRIKAMWKGWRKHAKKNN